MQPIIYESTDAGAPQLSAAAGTMNLVLKSCLVTGYGAKLAAGWEAVHENLSTNKLALRSTSPKSIKSVLLVTDTSTSQADVIAYQDWNATTNVGISAFGTRIFPKVLSGLSTPKWVVIATSSFFYLWIQHTSGANYGIISAFGDVLPIGLNTPLSLLFTKTGGGNGLFYLDVSNSAQARMPKVPMANADNGFGDADAAGGKGYISDIAIFSRCAIYTSVSEKWKPTFEMPGLMMPHTQKEYKATDPIVFELANQIPYVNPLIALHQPFQGNFWLHTDDWG